MAKFRNLGHLNRKFTSLTSVHESLACAEEAALTHATSCLTKAAEGSAPENAAAPADGIWRQQAGTCPRNADACLSAQAAAQSQT